MISFKQFLKEAEFHNWDHERSDAEIEHLNSKLQEHHKYLPSQREALETYTRDSSPINEHLWDAHIHKKPIESDFGIYAGHLDHAIHENKAPHDFHVYSGVPSDPRERMNKEKIVHHPAYLSTSLAHQTARGFAKAVDHKSKIVPNPNYETMKALNPKLNIGKDMHENHFNKHVLRIKVPKGHPGAYVERITDHNGEYEHILPRGLNLKHTGTDVIHEGSSTYRTHTLIHHFTIVPHD